MTVPLDIARDGVSRAARWSIRWGRNGADWFLELNRRAAAAACLLRERDDARTHAPCGGGPGGGMGARGAAEWGQEPLEAGTSQAAPPAGAP